MFWHLSNALKRCAAAVAIAAIASAACACNRDAVANLSSPTPAEQNGGRLASSETIEVSGLILGIGIGTPITEAREKLDPLRAPGDHEPDRKEQAGTRIYWKLAGTEYDWIIVWANKAGQITRVRATPRPEKLKPFAEVGDLSRAAAIQPQQAIWNVERPNALSYRLIAQGNDRLAKSVYMFALNLDMR
jgi:hypothetical protein